VSRNLSLFKVTTWGREEPYVTQTPNNKTLLITVNLNHNNDTFSSEFILYINEQFHQLIVSTIEASINNKKLLIILDSSSTLSLTNTDYFTDIDIFKCNDKLLILSGTG